MKKWLLSTVGLGFMTLPRVAADNMTGDISQQFSTAFGSPLVLGLVVLGAIIVLAVKGGLSGAAVIVITLPLVLTMAFGGYLPTPIAFIALAIAGFLTYYIIRESIGGGYR